MRLPSLYHNFAYGMIAWVLGTGLLYADDPAPTQLKHWPGMAEVGILRPQVEFWIRIYGELNSDQGLLHDSRYISAVYETLDLRGKRGRSVVAAAEAKWRRVLLSTHQKWNREGGVKEADLTPDEQHVVHLFRDLDDPDKFLNAAHRRRIRFQAGQKNYFAQGYAISGRYLPQMEAIFARAGLPLELTRLPFVESSFNVAARSKVGASGIWQFMPSTGRLYLKLNEAVDERDDPIRATEAAAELLRTNFQALGTWPLAVTAYNHGRKGIQRAVRKLGSLELNDLIVDYHRRSFGFASGNFYTCLLAALEVEKNADRYFKDLQKKQPERTFEFVLTEAVRIPSVIQLMHLDRSELKRLNPALDDRVWSGKLLAPSGYHLRMPLGAENNEETALRVFSKGYELIPEALKRGPASLSRTY